MLEPWKRPARTEQELASVRERVAKFHQVEQFTCDTCDVRNECRYAFDYYNTNGDCLAEK